MPTFCPEPSTKLNVHEFGFCLWCVKGTVHTELEVFDGLWGKIDSWNRVGTGYGTELAMSHKMLLFNAGIDFSSPADSCILFAWWK